MKDGLGGVVVRRPLSILTVRGASNKESAAERILDTDTKGPGKDASEEGPPAPASCSLPNQVRVL